jgi:hypothetical protein
MTKLYPDGNILEAKTLPGEWYQLQTGRGAGREPFRSYIEWLRWREGIAYVGVHL